MKKIILLLLLLLLLVVCISGCSTTQEKKCFYMVTTSLGNHADCRDVNCSYGNCLAYNCDDGYEYAQISAYKHVCI